MDEGRCARMTTIYLPTRQRVKERPWRIKKADSEVSTGNEFSES